MSCVADKGMKLFLKRVGEAVMRYRYMNSRFKFTKTKLDRNKNKGG